MDRLYIITSTHHNFIANSLAWVRGKKIVISLEKKQSSFVLCGGETVR